MALIFPIHLSDAVRLQFLSRETFFETFVHQNTEEDMKAYLTENLSLDQLKKEIQTEGTRFFGIKREEPWVGYLKVNNPEAQKEVHLENSLEIERIYVRGDFHGQGFGKALLQFAEELAVLDHRGWIWLGVWEENKAAIGFYSHQGFEAFGAQDFQLGSDLQRDILMRRKVGRESR